MVSFQALKQTAPAIQNRITGAVCFKRKKPCFAAHLCCIFKTKIVMLQPFFEHQF